MDELFLSKGIPVVPSLGKFAIVVKPSVRKPDPSYQGTTISGVSLSSTLNLQFDPDDPFQLMYVIWHGIRSISLFTEYIDGGTQWNHL